MKPIDLSQLGISLPKEILQNLSYEELFQRETDASLEGLEKCVVTEFGAVSVETGTFTGRSPKDKYVVVEPGSKDNIWWANPKGDGSDNHPLSLEAWRHLKEICVRQFEGKTLFVMDGFSGASPATRIKVRLVTEIAWMAHFFKNMLIRPTADELTDFIPDWTILHACKATCTDFSRHNMNSEVFVASHFAERMTLIGGTWYSGEVKKALLAVMNYYLPLKGVGSFHCSANMGHEGDTALFFGLSATGKTTLSADPHRYLIGDDEHGWDAEGIFNFEGGCYVKCINLSKENSPDIFGAIKRHALLENVAVDAQGRVDFTSAKKTENTRVSYPIDFIPQIVSPVSKGGHPSRIIFLTCDAFGVLPAVSLLTREQAMYHYLSGYTAKVAGTECGISQPKVTFSTCFGQAFLTLHPMKYAQILGQKIEDHATKVYLINTGWYGGATNGLGKRIPVGATRAIVDAILDGSMDYAIWDVMPVFHLEFPIEVKGVDANILNPRNSWVDKNAYDAQCRKLAAMFNENFVQFTDTPQGKKLTAAGPVIRDRHEAKRFIHSL